MSDTCRSWGCDGIPTCFRQCVCVCVCQSTVPIVPTSGCFKPRILRHCLLLPPLETSLAFRFPLFRFVSKTPLKMLVKEGGACTAGFKGSCFGIGLMKKFRHHLGNRFGTQPLGSCGPGTDPFRASGPKWGRKWPKHGFWPDLGNGGKMAWKTGKIPKMEKWPENGISGHFSFFAGHVSPILQVRPNPLFGPFSSPFRAGGPKWICTRSTGSQPNPHFQGENTHTHKSVGRKCRSSAFLAAT